MKITSLTIHNVGAIENEVIALNKPLILFYGEIRQGKTTILNAVRWVCGGSYPSDIIRHGESEAFVELGFEGGSVRREWYRNQKGETVDRPVSFVINGKRVPAPVAELKKLLNPFLLNQDHLRQMTETERKKFFVELFSVDTKDLDTAAYNASQEAVKLRAKISGYGNIDLTPVEPVDVAPLKAELAKIRSDYEVLLYSREDMNRQIQNQNVLIKNARVSLCQAIADIEKYKEQLAKAQQDYEHFEKFCSENRELLNEHPRPTPPDTAELESMIQTAAAKNVLAAQYNANKSRAAQRDDDERNLRNLEAKQREIRDQKIARLAKSCEVVPGLVFDEDGGFTYEGTQAGMLSTSQIMKLSSAVSSLYPEGLGVELLDRGESLGKSIFEYVDRAKEKSLTVLATIVGEAPAKAPESVGVFVVEKGKVNEVPQTPPV